MNIIITGGAGFIGSNLAHYLDKKGHNVTCLDNFITSGHPSSRYSEIVECDVSSDEIFYNLKYFRKADWVLHLASPASPKFYRQYPIETINANVTGTHNLLTICEIYNISFLLASTSEVYGDPLIAPQNEDYWGNVNPIGPRSVYDESKRLAETLTMAYHRKYKLDTRIVRLFNSYGYGMKPDDGRLIPNLITQALKNEPMTVYGDGSQTRSFCFITDTVRGIYSLIKSNYTLPINIGNPDEVTVKYIVSKIEEITKTKSKIVYNPLPQDDPKRRIPDITKAKQILSWQPLVPLELGLKNTVDYFKKIL